MPKVRRVPMMTPMECLYPVPVQVSGSSDKNVEIRHVGLSGDELENTPSGHWTGVFNRKRQR